MVGILVGCRDSDNGGKYYSDVEVYGGRGSNSSDDNFVLGCLLVMSHAFLVAFEAAKASDAPRFLKNVDGVFIKVSRVDSCNILKLCFPSFAALILIFFVLAVRSGG